MNMINDFRDMFINDELKLIKWIAYIMIISAVILFLLIHVMKYNAPYGRYASSAWGPLIDSRLGWFIQTTPSFAVPVVSALYSDSPKLQNTANYLLLMMFSLHYFHRGLIYPFLIREGKKLPLMFSLCAVIFCFLNGYIQGRYLTKYAQYPHGWTTDPSFMLGTGLFLMGFVINIHSDHILINLRKEGETGYKIPYGGMFNYVSGANFLGEIVEWAGFALASQSLVAFAFMLLTVSNIGPRAMAYHRWYLDKFKEEYPKNRRALIPFLL